MSDKCKWVDGKYIHCDGLNDDAIIRMSWINYCWHCGESLKEPIPEEPALSYLHGEGQTEANIISLFQDVSRLSDRIDYLMKKVNDDS